MEAAVIFVMLGQNVVDFKSSKLLCGMGDPSPTFKGIIARIAHNCNL